MAENDTLLAYLVPKLNYGVEDAATEAEAYIPTQIRRFLDFAGKTVH